MDYARVSAPWPLGEEWGCRPHPICSGRPVPSWEADLEPQAPALGEQGFRQIPSGWCPAAPRTQAGVLEPSMAFRAAVAGGQFMVHWTLKASSRGKQEEGHPSVSFVLPTSFLVSPFLCNYISSGHWCLKTSLFKRSEQPKVSTWVCRAPCSLYM